MCWFFHFYFLEVCALVFSFFQVCFLKVVCTTNTIRFFKSLTINNKENKIGEKRTEVVNSLAPALFWCVHCRQWMSFWENPDSWRERIKWATFSIPLYTGPLPWFHKAYTFLTPKVDLNKKHHLAHCYTWACIHFHIQINWATFSAGACAYISVGKGIIVHHPSCWKYTLRFTEQNSWL